MLLKLYNFRFQSFPGIHYVNILADPERPCHLYLPNSLLYDFFCFVFWVAQHQILLTQHNIRQHYLKICIAISTISLEEVQLNFNKTFMATTLCQKVWKRSEFELCRTYYKYWSLIQALFLAAVSFSMQLGIPVFARMILTVITSVFIFEGRQYMAKYHNAFKLEAHDCIIFFFIFPKFYERTR